MRLEDEDVAMRGRVGTPCGPIINPSGRSKKERALLLEEQRKRLQRRLSGAPETVYNRDAGIGLVPEHLVPEIGTPCEPRARSFKRSKKGLGRRQNRRQRHLQKLEKRLLSL